MSTQKIIYVSLISMLIVSLLIPTLSAGVPSMADDDDDDEEFDRYDLSGEADKESIARTSAYADAPNIVRFTGSVVSKLDSSGIEGVPISFGVLGSGGGTYMDPRLIGNTKSDGSFEFDFEITTTMPLGKYKARIFAGNGWIDIPFEVVEGTYPITVTSNLPKDIVEKTEAELSFDDPTTGISPVPLPHEGLSKEFKVPTGSNQLSVEPFIRDPDDNDYEWVCDRCVIVVTEETTVNFEYRRERARAIEPTTTQDIEPTTTQTSYDYGKLPDIVVILAVIGAIGFFLMWWLFLRKLSKVKKKKP